MLSKKPNTKLKTQIPNPKLKNKTLDSKPQIATDLERERERESWVFGHRFRERELGFRPRLREREGGLGFQPKKVGFLAKVYRERKLGFRP